MSSKHHTAETAPRFAILLIAACLCVSCGSVYYGAMEKFGIHKRDLLVGKVEAARDSQQEAKEQFQSAFEQFASVTGFQGGALEDTYRRLEGQLAASEGKAKAVRARNNEVERVSEDLFREWEKEIGEFQNASFRRSSESQLREARQRYSGLIRAMRSAESRMDPVLIAFRDQVRFLKHNLNARAVAALQSEVNKVSYDVTTLIREMERAMAEADNFLRTLDSN